MCVCVHVCVPLTLSTQVSDKAVHLFVRLSPAAAVNAWCTWAPRQSRCAHSGLKARFFFCFSFLLLLFICWRSSYLFYLCKSQFSIFVFSFFFTIFLTIVTIIFQALHLLSFIFFTFFYRLSITLFISSTLTQISQWTKTRYFEWGIRIRKIPQCASFISICLPLCPSVCLCFCLSPCLSVCMSVYVDSTRSVCSKRGHPTDKQDIFIGQAVPSGQHPFSASPSDTDENTP